MRLVDTTALEFSVVARFSLYKSFTSKRIANGKVPTNFIENIIEFPSVLFSFLFFFHLVLLHRQQGGFVP